MVGTAVVGNDVHYHLHALLMGLLDIFLVLGIAAETRVDTVVIPTSVAVVGLPVLVVHEERRTPNGRGAQVGDIVKMVDNSLKITAVAAERLLSLGLLKGIISVVISWIGVGETVGIDQVNEIRCSETGPLS